MSVLREGLEGHHTKTPCLRYSPRNPCDAQISINRTAWLVRQWRGRQAEANGSRRRGRAVVGTPDPRPYVVFMIYTPTCVGKN